MSNHSAIKALSKKVAPILFGQICPTYNKIITDVFDTPNMWILAKAVYRERLHYAGFPLLPGDTLTLVLAFNDHSLEAVKDVVLADYKHLPLGEDILELVRNLPDMLDPTQERERERLRGQ
jgi:hypothetical protein